MKIAKILLLVFVIASVLDVVGILFNSPILIQLFKPLILLSLLALYTVSVSEINKKYALALIFSFFGDVFLIFNSELYFIIGLVSFLTAHLLFITILIKNIKNYNKLHLLTSIIPFLLLLISLLYVIKDSLNNLLIPVIIYGITISTFGVVAMLNYLSSKNYKSFLMFVGAVVFIASDAILAINKFYSTTDVLEVFIMVTYITAQYIIYKSMVFGNLKIKS